MMFLSIAVERLAGYIEIALAVKRRHSLIRKGWTKSRPERRPSWVTFLNWGGLAVA